ncbi:Poly (ADP-ribose) polymerase, member 14 [Sorochytrium milnesiophthora]
MAGAHKHVSVRGVVDPTDTSSDLAIERAGDWDLIYRACAKTKYRLVKVEYMENPGLLEQFQCTRDQFAAEAGKDSDEVLVFHGTLAENVEAIQRDGLLVGGKAGHEQRYEEVSLGHGVYTARSVAYAAVYSPGDDTGVRKVIGLLALRGAVTEPHLGPRRARKNAVPEDEVDSWDNSEWCAP